MGSDNFEQELGDLSGQLKALMPTLERMEGRLHQAQIDAAAAEARNQALRKDFDDLKGKVSNRLADLYHRLEVVVLDNTNLKNHNGNLKRDIKDAVERSVGPLRTKVLDSESKLATIEEKKKSGWSKVWEVVKILIAAGVGAGVSKLIK
jgi:chromosome segregation ATPase